MSVRTISYGPIFEYWDVAPDLAILHMDDGGWRFEHVCHSPRSGQVYRIAPALTNVGEPGGHQIVSTEPLHIEPSILCPDCGIHGWVREGKWGSA